MSKIFEQILAGRGFGRDFLEPKYEECIDPYMLPDMKKAVERVRQAVKTGEKLLIYGDYDADGVTASTVLYDILKLAGAAVGNLEVMLPNRFEDGYGMSKKVVQRAVETGVGLVMTVDCGSRNHEIIEELLAAGVETVVTDHHECGETLPPAVAVVNPKRTDWLPSGSVDLSKSSPVGRDFDPVQPGDNLQVTNSSALSSLRQLAGVGVVFKLAQALVKAGMIPEGQEKWLLDLVAVGTICDSMRLVGENRRLCRYGLLVLEKTRRPGVKELLLNAGVKNLNSEAVGFQIGPRLNAAGRMESAERALELLMAEKRTEGARLALGLEELNKRRRSEQDAALREIEERGVGDDSVIVEVGEWHEGVLGIIAGKLVEAYRRPALVLAPAGEGKLKGSGRSFGEFNLAAAIDVCRKYLVRGGGHAEACGLTLERENLEKFKEAVNTYYRSLELKEQERFLQVREDVVVEEIEELSLELLDEMRKLEPYGEGNREPVFLLPGARVVEAAKLGADGQHLRIMVWDKQGKGLKLMRFYASEEELSLRGGEAVDVWFTLTENVFRGIRSVEGRILRIK